MVGEPEHLLVFEDEIEEYFLVLPKASWHSILPTLTVGLAIREFLTPFTGHPFDFEIWVRLGYYVSQGFDPYRFTGPVQGLSIPGTGYLPSIGYPPLWAFMQVAIYKFYSLVSLDNRFFYYFIVKQQMVLGDMFVGYLLYRLVVARAGTEKGYRAFRFWMLCPLVIIISAIWGIFDQLVLAFTLLSLLLAQTTFRSSIAVGVGILLKAIPVIYLPILMMFQKSWRRRLAYLLTSAGVLIFVTLIPYAVFGDWKLSSLVGTAEDTIHKIGNSMNYWVVPYTLASYSSFQGDIYRVLGILGYAWIPALFLAYFYCATKLQKRTLGDNLGLYYMILVTLVFFLTRSQINEQYTIYFLGLALIDVLTNGQKRKKIFTAIWVSATAFLIANNTYLVRFLAPLSASVGQLDQALISGFPGDVRTLLMMSSALSFTLFCVLYLKSIYSQISFESSKGSKVPKVESASGN